MKLTSFSVENYLGVTRKVTLNLESGLTTIIGAPGIDLNAVVDGLAIFLGYRWPAPEDFPRNSENTASPAITFTARFADVPETLSPDRHSYFRLSSEYLLGQGGGLEVSRSFRMTREGLQERVYATAMHPSEPGLSDLLQVNNTILKRRLTNSTVSANAVDRRCNSAIRHALWEHSADLGLKLTEVSLCRGDALLIWQALQMHFPIMRVVRGRNAGHHHAESGRETSPHANLVRVAPRHFATHRSQDLSLLEPSELYDLPPSQQWIIIPPQVINKTDPPAAIPGETFLAEGGRSTAGTHGIGHLYCVHAPDHFSDDAVRARWIARLSDLAAQPGHMVLLAVNLPATLSGLPQQTIQVLSRNAAGHLECLDERPVETGTGVPQVAAPNPILRVSRG